jgi:heme/copper-type cytochrome/quinol oxidase subunit 3
MGAAATPMPNALPVRREPLVPNGVFGMILFVIAETMVFAGMMSAFNIVRANAVGLWPPAWQPRLPVETTAFNTVMLLASGVTLFLAIRALKNKSPHLGKLLVATFALGAYFVLAQGFEWTQLIAAGLTMKSSQHGAFFYLIVGAHGVHAIGALGGLLYVLLQHRKGTASKSQLWTASVFWYFVVGIWPALYTLVYL